MTRKSARKPMAQEPHTVALHIADIVPDPDQPRKTFPPSGLTGLSQSLAQTGQISPLTVRPGPEGKYTIVVGERRWRAAKEAGLSHVECIIRHDVDEQKAREMQFAENYQRDDIPPLEQAKSLKTYLESYNVSQRELSRRTGIPQRTISDRLALLKLPVSVHAQIEAGKIGPHEAIRISALPAEHRETLAEALSSGRIGGRILEKVARVARAAPGKPIGDIIRELVSPQAIQVSQPEATDLSVEKPLPAPHADPLSGVGSPRGDKETTLGPVTQTVRATPAPTADDIESDPEIVELKKEIRKAELERELGRAKMPPEVAVLVAAAQEFGERRHEDCPHEEDGVCAYWIWDSQEEIPQGIGEPICDGKGVWRIKPSMLYCAICPISLEDDFLALDDELNNTPLRNLRERFSCECRAKGMVAVHIKCTKCGKERWRGWWPSQ